jgi:hypothetical protein
MIITIETIDEDLINDILEISENYFDFNELGITNDEDKMKHWITSMIKDKVNDLRKRRAIDDIQYTKIETI